MTLLVRDEADIVEQFLVYHLNQGVDHILAIDDGSTDGTPEILDSFRKAGLVTVVPRPDGTYCEKEAEWHTRLARQAATEHRADWILVGDADEFWWPLWGDFKDVLRTVSSDREAVIVPRSDFVFVSPPTRSAPQDFTARETVSALRPKLALRGSPALALSKGAHRASVGAKLWQLTDTDVGRPIRVSPVAGLRIFHFGVRGDAQLERVAERGRGQDDAEGRAAHRDALYRRSPQDTPFSAFDERWRQDELSRGIAEGDLVPDDRLAARYERCSDPRQGNSHKTDHPPSCSPCGRTEVLDEIAEVQALIIDSLQQENAKMQGQIARLNRAVKKEREARQRGPLSGVRRKLPWIDNYLERRFRSRRP